jgi:hypothetical protein
MIRFRNCSGFSLWLVLFLRQENSSTDKNRMLFFCQLLAQIGQEKYFSAYGSYVVLYCSWLRDCFENQDMPKLKEVLF